MLPACAQVVHVGTPASLEPAVYEQINRATQRGRVHVALGQETLSDPAGLRITTRSVLWTEGGLDRTAPVEDLRCVWTSKRRTTLGHRMGSALVAWFGAGVGATTYFALTEEGGGAPGIVGGLILNTVIFAPLSFPAGFILAPYLPGGRLYDFRSSSAPAPPKRCGAPA